MISNKQNVQTVKVKIKCDKCGFKTAKLFYRHELDEEQTCPKCDNTLEVEVWERRHITK